MTLHTYRGATQDAQAPSLEGRRDSLREERAQPPSLRNPRCHLRSQRRIAVFRNILHDRGHLSDRVAAHKVIELDTALSCGVQFCEDRRDP
eukprot:1842947-Rhodomonas_salina.2